MPFIVAIIGKSRQTQNLQVANIEDFDVAADVIEYVIALRLTRCNPVTRGPRQLAELHAHILRTLRRLEHQIETDNLIVRCEQPNLSAVPDTVGRTTGRCAQFILQDLIATVIGPDSGQLCNCLGRELTESERSKREDRAAIGKSAGAFEVSRSHIPCPRLACAWPVEILAAGKKLARHGNTLKAQILRSPSINLERHVTLSRMQPERTD